MLKVKYNLILVIINRLTKYNIFKLYKEANIAKDLLYIINQLIVANYKTLDKCITNKDKLFISKFQHFITRQLETLYKMLTLYYL